MKIAHVITGLTTGGAEIMLYKLLSQSDSSEHPSLVVSLTAGGPTRDKIEALGIPVYSLGGRGMASMPRLVPSLRRILEAFSPDVIQCWMYHSNLIAQVATIGSAIKAPVVWNVRHSLDSIREEKLQTKLTISAGVALSHLSSRIIYNSAKSSKQHEMIGYRSDRTLVIPNGFDCAQFAPSSESYLSVRSELGLRPDTKLLGLIGRYNPAKDHRTFILAASKLASEMSGVDFLLAGRDINLKNDELATLVNSTGFRDRFHLLGERADVPKITAALDVGTCTSITEGFPNVVGEAMASGVPCVVTDVGDNRLILGDTGVVVPPRNPHAVADGWKSLLGLEESERKELAHRVRQRIIASYSLDSVIAMYTDLYQELQGSTLSSMSK